jgi:hypothetical protein
MSDRADPILTIFSSEAPGNAGIVLGNISRMTSSGASMGNPSSEASSCSCNQNKLKILGSHGGECEDGRLMGCCNL